MDPASSMGPAGAPWYPPPDAASVPPPDIYHGQLNMGMYTGQQAMLHYPPPPGPPEAAPGVNDAAQTTDEYSPFEVGTTSSTVPVLPTEAQPNASYYMQQMPYGVPEQQLPYGQGQPSAAQLQYGQVPHQAASHDQPAEHGQATQEVVYGQAPQPTSYGGLIAQMKAAQGSRHRSRSRSRGRSSSRYTIIIYYTPSLLQTPSFSHAQTHAHKLIKMPVNCLDSFKFTGIARRDSRSPSCWLGARQIIKSC